MSNSFKRKLSAFVSMLALVSISSAAMAADVNTGTFTASNVLGKTNNAEVAIKNNRMDINVIGKKGAVAQVDFRNFNVKKSQQVNYGFSNTSQTMINRVLGGTKSSIYGRMTNSSIGGTGYAETGKVILINPAGVMFGAGSTVDLNSLTVSTFDMKGAKNLKGMTEAQLKSYQNNVLNKLSPSVTTNGVKSESKNITFDSNYTSELDKGLKGEGVKNGIKDYAGKSKITLNGAHFDKFTNQTNTEEAAFNSNKAISFVSDNIDYKDSIIRVGNSNNYAGNKSYGNVRLVTADGVTFTYSDSGSEVGYEIPTGTKDNITRNINIDNKGLDGKTAIDASDIRIRNHSTGKDSNITIKNTVIKARKLASTSLNNIQILGSGDVDVENTRIDTENTKYMNNGKEVVTSSRTGGQVYIRADQNLNIKDSVIKTAGSDQEGTNSGNVNLIAANGTANTDNLKVLANGDIYVRSNKNEVNINDSLLKAKNFTGSNPADKNVQIKANKDININDSVASASGNVDIVSANGNGVTSGNINITSTQKDGVNQTLLKAEKNLSIEGKNTTLDNVSTRYQTVKFYNNNTTGTNNVTVKNGTTFSQYKADNIARTNDITLTTNGNFTMDNATMRTGNVDNVTAEDNGTAKTFDFEVKSGNERMNNLTVTSTEGNVNVINGSDINVKNDIKFTSSKGNYTQTASKLTSEEGNVNIGADKNINISEGSKISAGKDVDTYASKGGDINITAKTGSYIQNNSDISGKDNVNITADKNVNMVNNSSVYSKHDAKIKSNNGSIGQIDSRITSFEDDINLEAKGNIETSGSTIGTNGKVNITSTNGSYKQGEASATTIDTDTQKEALFKFGKSSISAASVNIDAQKDVKISNTSTINSQFGSIDINAHEGKYTQSASKLTSAQNVNVTAKQDLTVDQKGVYTQRATDIRNRASVGIDAKEDVNLTSQEGDYKQIKQSINADNINIEATKGSVNIADTAFNKAGNDINVKSANTIKFGLEKDKSANIDNSAGFLAGNNIKFQSTNGDIVAEKTEMAQYSLGHEGAHATGPYADINYGNRLEFNAKGDNVFTSQNSLKSVNVDYIAGGSNKFDTQGDIQFVNSSLQGQENIINSGDDVVLNNLTADNAKTQINAAGYITTENVTGEDLSAKGGSFPQSVSVDLQPGCDPAPEVNPIYSGEDSYSGQTGQTSAQESAITEELAEEETISEPRIVGNPISEDGHPTIEAPGETETVSTPGIVGVVIPAQEHPTIEAPGETETVSTPGIVGVVIPAQEHPTIEAPGETETVSTPAVVGVPVPEENPEIITIQGPSQEAKYSTITKEDISGVFVPKQEPTIKKIEDK